MSYPDDLTRLRHMRDAAQEVLMFMRGKGRDDLESDRMLSLAVVKDLEIIGEAASRVSQDCQTRYLDLPSLVKNQDGSSNYSPPISQHKIEIT